MEKGSYKTLRVPVSILLILIRKNLFWAGCILFIILLPFETRYTNIAIGVMGAGWIMDGDLKTKWGRFKRNSDGFWIFIFYAISVASILYSKDLLTALSKLETKLPLALMPILVFGSSLSAKQISQILRVFILSMIFTALYCLLRAAGTYAETGEVNSFFYQWLTMPTKLTAIYFANFLCFGVLVILFAKELDISRRWRFFLVSFMILVILMLAALSVTGYLALLGLVYGWFFFRKRLSFAKSLIMLALCGLAFVTTAWMLPYTNTKIVKMTNLHYEMSYPDSMWNTVTIRLAKWKCATSVIIEHPVFGVGVGDEYHELMESYARHGFSEGIRNTYNEHNQYLASMVSTGLPGFIALIGMLFFPFKRSFQSKDYLLTGFLALMIVSFTTENFLYIQKGVLFFGFFYALLIRRTALRENAMLTQGKHPNS